MVSSIQDKNILPMRVLVIANRYSISKVSVGSIINSYISILRDELLGGREIRVLGLFSIVPNVIVDNRISTTACIAQKVSDDTGISYTTCFHVIKSYLEALKDELSQGISVDVRSIVTLHPIFEEGTLTCIHASVSSSIRRDLAIQNGAVTSVRVHTSKLLKSVLCTKEA